VPRLSTIDPIPAPVLPWEEEVKTNLSSTACRRSAALACVLGAFIALTVPSHPVTLAQGPPGSGLRLQKGHLVYTGAFRLPDGTSGSTFDGGGRPMTFNPANGTLLIAGISQQQIAEVNIPAIRTGASLENLATATIRTPFRRLADLQLLQCGEAKLTGGMLPWAGDLIVSGYCYFDGGGEQRSHYKNGVGPVQVGSIGSGFVSGPMAMIPTEWQSRFGGPALTSQWSIPIVSRTSAGPAASVFNPADVGVKNPVPATPVVGYPYDDDQHRMTLGNDGDGTLYSTTQYAGGLVFPPGTRTVLFFAGRKALGPFCYGEGVDNPALHGTRDATGETVCYDPVNHDKGTHGYPYAHFVYAYDANDLVAVKNRRKQPWEVKPYATWAFDLPFQHAQRVIAGVAYDSETKRVFLTAANGDGDKPLVHVFTIDGAASVTTPVGPVAALRRAPLGVDTERRLAAPRFRDTDAGEGGEPGGEASTERATTHHGSGTDAAPAASPATGMMRQRAVARARATTPPPRDQAPMPAATDARRAPPARVAECPGTNPFANSDGQIGVCVNGAWTVVPGIRTGGVVRQRQGASGEEVWLIQTDEAVYEVAGGLGAAYQTDGLPVVFEGRFPNDVPSDSTGAVVVEIRQINVVRLP
jgi:hypothetical protein